MNNKSKIVTAAGLAVLLVSAAACGEQVSLPAQEPAGTYVENIYIGDTIVTEIFSENAQNISPVEVVTVYENNAPTDAPAVTAEATPVTQGTASSSAAGETLEQALENVKSAINNTKNAKDFSAEQTMNVNIQLTDCSLSALVTPINAILKHFLGEHIYEYKFVNGECDDPREKVDKATPMYSIPPGDRLFSLEPAGVASWSMEKEGANTVYCLTIVSEKTTLQDIVPTYHAQAMDYLDFSEYDFGIAKIDDSESNYPGAEIVVKTDSEGRMIYLSENLRIYGSGTGSLGLSVSAAFDGSIQEQWKIEW